VPLKGGRTRCPRELESGINDAWSTSSIDDVVVFVDDLDSTPELLVSTLVSSVTNTSVRLPGLVCRASIEFH
jgi:hypothetical protein